MMSLRYCCDTPSSAAAAFCDPARFTRWVSSLIGSMGKALYHRATAVDKYRTRAYCRPMTTNNRSEGGAMDDRTVPVFIESGLLSILTASNVAVLDSKVGAGLNEFSIRELRLLVARTDRLIVSAPTRYRAKIRAFRNGLVTAAGPEFADVVGWLG